MKSAGFILVTFLLLLSLLSLLIIEICDNMIWQHRTARYWQYQQQLFNLAGSGLKRGEKTLTDNCQPNLCITVQLLTTVVHKIGTSSVIMHYYQITSKATQHDLSVTLQSSYVTFSPPLPSVEGIEAGRQSWRELF